MTDTMPGSMTDEQRAYLEARSLAVLATGRRDGSPQQSLVSYFFDGEALLMSVTRDRAKYQNAVRQPRVSVLVADGRRQVVVYGVASVVEGRPRDEAIQAIRVHQGNPLPDGTDLDAFSKRLDELGRVVLRVVPERVLGLEPGEPS
jgi:PPOX class probable F420-dependent enzyme